MTADVKVMRVESETSVTSGTTATMLKERQIKSVGFERGSESKRQCGEPCHFILSRHGFPAGSVSGAINMIENAARRYPLPWTASKFQIYRRVTSANII